MKLTSSYPHMIFGTHDQSIKPSPITKIMSAVQYHPAPSFIAPEGAFVSTWTIPDGGLEIVLPFVVAGTYDVEINWGDDTPNSTGGDASDDSWYTHTFANTTGNPSDRVITIWGSATHLSTLDSTEASRNAISTVTELGDLGWTDLSHAFYYCINLTTVACTADLSTVTNMGNMFNEATNVNPDVADWDMSNVTDINAMFGNTDLADPDITLWDLGSCVDARYAFYNCVGMTNAALADQLWKNVDIVDFIGCFSNAVNISNYADIPGTWKGGDKLTLTFNITSAPTAIVLPFVASGEYAAHIDWDGEANTAGDDGSVSTWFTHTFTSTGTKTVTVDGYATHLSYLDGNITSREALLGVPDTGDMGWTSWENAFYECTNLTSVTLGEILNLTNMSNLFYGATSANPDVSAWDVSNITNMSGAFRGATSANPILTNWDVSSVTDMSYMFYAVEAASIDIATWDMSSVTNIAGMFMYLANANPDVSAWDTSSITDMSYLFFQNDSASYNNDNLVPVVTSWNTSNVTNMTYVFRAAWHANPNVASWDTSSVTSMYGMFYNAIVANPNVASWDTSSVLNMGKMFAKTQLADPDVSTWNVSNVTSMQEMFGGFADQNTSQALNPDVSNWDVSSVTNMSYVFWRNWNNVMNPDVSNWDVSSVTTIHVMFQESKHLNPDVSAWDLSNCTDCMNAFLNCTGMTNAVPAAQFWERITPVWADHDRCFMYSTSISNYGNIPNNWKGL